PYQELFLVLFGTVPPPSNKVHGAIPPFNWSYTQQAEACVNSRLKAMHEWRQLYRGLELRTGHTNRCRKGSANHSSVKYQGALSAGPNLRLHRLAPTAGRLLSGNLGAGHAQAAIRGIETSLGAPPTLGKIRWWATI